MWVLPYAALLLVLAAIFWRFIRDLPTRTRLRFLLAAAVYVSGAAGLEIIGGLYHEVHGSKNVGFVLLESFEDTMEMAGMVIFIHALMSYIATELSELRLRVSAT